MTEGAMTADPLRAYVITLRKGRRITQANLAKQIGMAERTYVSWERGNTKSIKEHFARALIVALEGSREHLDMLDQMSPEAARQLAHEWLALSSEEQQQTQTNAQKLHRIVELQEDDAKGLEEIIEQLRTDARADPAFLTWLSGFLAGRRGDRPRPR